MADQRWQQPNVLPLKSRHPRSGEWSLDAAAEQCVGVGGNGLVQAGAAGAGAQAGGGVVEHRPVAQRAVA
jgi:hypothetical protein